MKNLEPKTLEGAYIRLVPLSISHHAPLCDIGLEEDLWRLTTNEVLTQIEMLNYIQTALEDQATGTSLPFVIFEKEHGTIVGSSRYHSLNRIQRRLVIGHTWIGRNWQRTLVNTEAKYLMLKYAFEELQCLRVEFIVNSINERSRRALLRIGAKQEGILRSYAIGKDKKPCDVALFSIIETEWPEIKANLELKLRNNRSTSTAELVKGYDAVAVAYADEFRDEMEHKPFDRQMLNWLIEKVGDLGPICDMGCGPGQIAKYLHNQGAETFGVDISAEMVRQAQLLSPEIRFEQGDMLALENIASDSLGGIAVFYSIVHIPRESLPQVFSEFLRVLRRGGALLVTHHIGSHTVHRDEWFGKEVSVDFLFFETQEVKEHINRSGLIPEEAIERDPYANIEYPSRRAYIFARKQ